MTPETAPYPTPVARHGGLSGLLGKVALRDALLHRRKVIPHDLADTTRWKVTNHLRTLLGTFRPSTIALYYPHGSEIDLRPLADELRRDGWTVLLPRVVCKGFPLAFNVWHADAPLERDAAGLLSAVGPEVLPGVVVMPMVGYSREGYRLGSGGGYYDATLAALRHPVRTIGVCHTELEVHNFPAEPHDLKLDVVVTGKEVILA